MPRPGAGTARGGVAQARRQKSVRPTDSRRTALTDGIEERLGHPPPGEGVTTRRATMAPPTTDPTAVYRYRDTLLAADAIAAAVVHLDLLTELAREPADLPALCRRLAVHPRPADALCTL